eukprot:TRINITY_DN44052_c0_g1_i1.p1 TRINITY_DN44052_c0_g1~~TRINITY_DN44052_c0_g1_i1.p1  ORF type:complete len:142 (-),score=16.32 TRINITY_DN44052_c0_g1_i1:10-435(-)
MIRLATVEQVESGVSHLLHSRGINIRHVGLLRSNVKDVRIREILLAEMVSRTLKHNLTTWLKDANRKLGQERRGSATYSPLTEVGAGFLNLVSGVSPRANDFWIDVREGVQRRFGHHALTQEIGRAVQQECRDRSRMPSSA